MSRWQSGIGLLLALCGLPSWADEPSRPWPQSQSDIEADPAVLFGTLPNGMRYAILANQTPKGQVAVRLRIDAGSMQESDSQQGVAHFIEHMAFRGSTHIADNEAFRILARFGAVPGADSNAFTQQSETVFKIDLPTNSSDAIDTALMFMRDTAGELLLRQESVDSERSVVLAEERLRDTPAARLNKAELAFVFAGQPVGERLPIGKIEVLTAVGAPDLRTFYDEFYRPERATLVVVGDLSAQALQDKIVGRFGDWQGRGPAGIDPEFGPPLPRGQEIHTQVEAGAPSVASVEWTKPADPRPDITARENDDAIAQLGLMVLDQRLQDMAQGEKPPFLGAHALSRPIGRSAQLTALAIGTTVTGWNGGLESGLAAIDRLVGGGIRQDELDRQKTRWRASLESAAAGAATRKSATLADQLVHAVDSEDVFVTPAADLQLFDRIMAGVTLTAVNQAVRQCFSGNGPLVFVGGPEPITGVDAVLAAARSTLSADAPPMPELWPYTAFGAAGTVVERRQENDLGLTMVRFANGVRLTVKPTKFHADQILLAADLGHGRLDLPIDHPTPLWAAEAGALIGGGLQLLALPDIERLLAGKLASVRFGLTDDAFVISGETRPQDFVTELQLLTAYLTAPGWRAEGFESVRNRLVAAIPQWDASPLGVFQRHAGELLHSNDPRWQAPDLDQVRSARLDDLRRVLDPVLTDAPIELVVVGDVGATDAIDAVAATLGALPARAAETVPVAAQGEVRFPSPTAEPVTLTHKGRSDQGLVVSAWPAVDSIEDLQQPRTIRVLQLILQQRLVDEFRTRLGGTYSPGTDMQASVDFPGFGFIFALAETPNTKMAEFDGTLAKITQELRATPVSEDEFERARKPRIETLLKAQQTNEWWLALLQRAQTQQVALPLIRSVIIDLQKVTPQAVRRAAETYLAEKRMWRLRVTPESDKSAGESNG